MKLSWSKPAKLGLRFSGRSTRRTWSHSPVLSSLNSTSGHPYASRSESSVMTTSARLALARYAICASASYGATQNRTPASCSACSGTVSVRDAAYTAHQTAERGLLPLLRLEALCGPACGILHVTCPYCSECTADGCSWFIHRVDHAPR